MSEPKKWDAIEIDREHEMAIAYFVDSHCVNFRVAAIAGNEMNEDGTNGAVLYSSEFGDDLTTNFDEAEPFMDGGVKWDGCSNWNLGTDQVMTHICGFRDMQRYAWAMERVYHLTAQLLPTFAADIADYPMTPA